MTTEQEILIRGAIAALTQNKTHPADIAAVKKWLNRALTDPVVGGRPGAAASQEISVVASERS